MKNHNFFFGVVLFATPPFSEPPVTLHHRGRHRHVALRVGQELRLEKVAQFLSKLEEEKGLQVPHGVTNSNPLF